MLISLRRWELVKKVHTTLAEFAICSRMTPIESCTLWIWPIFSISQIWNVSKFQKCKSSLKIEWYGVYKLSHCLSNGVITNVVIRDIDLHFQHHKLKTLIFQKLWELAQKNACYDVYRFLDLPTNGTFFNVLLGGLDINFQGTKFELLLSRNERELYN